MSFGSGCATQENFQVNIFCLKILGDKPKQDEREDRVAGLQLYLILHQGWSERIRINMGEKTMAIAETKMNGRDPVEMVQNLEKISQVNQIKETEKKSSQTTKASPGLTTRDVAEILESFQDLSQTIQTKLNFSVHEENNEIIVRVVDKETNQLVRQFPSDEMLELQDKMRDLAGFLLNADA